ncbi:MAG: hypothetical protein ACE5FU_14755, partial [Nitrospinota bacterium]
MADYVLLGNDGKNTSVLCAVTEKSNVEKFLHTLSRGGLDPEAVDVDLFGFFNTVRASLSGSPGTVLVLNVDSVNTSLLVVENGKLQCVRTLTIGFTHLNQEKEAPRQNKIFAEEQGVSPPSFNDEKVREFLVELKRVFSFV